MSSSSTKIPIWKDIFEIQHFTTNIKFYQQFLEKTTLTTSLDKKKYSLCEIYDTMNNLKQYGSVLKYNSVDCSNCDVLKDFVQFYNDNQHLRRYETDDLEYYENRTYCTIREKKQTWNPLSFLFKLRTKLMHG